MVYSVKDIPTIIKRIGSVKTYAKRKTAKHDRLDYIELPLSFDIETTSTIYKKTKIGFMYVWQMAIKDSVIIGRTWDEFKEAIKLLKDSLKTDVNKRCVIWVHNLAFEFQFLKSVLEFADVFFIDKKPVRAHTADGLEFRCTYLLTQKSLEKLANDLQEHTIRKLVGDLDYNKIRTHTTPLTEEELNYCINDVLIITAFIEEEIKKEHLATMPMTATGYIRRDCKRAFRKSTEWKLQMEELKLSVETYQFNKLVYQGAIVHANIVYSEKKLKNVWGIDFDSSYIAALISEKYPITSPVKVKPRTIAEFENYLKNYCCMFTIKFKELELLESATISPISVSKCVSVKGAQEDNGRIVKAEELTTYITDVDYDIYKKVFRWRGNPGIGSFYIMKRGFLPSEFIYICYDLYKAKKALKAVKDIGDNKYNYMLAKARLNALYGMIATKLEYGITVEEAVENFNNGFSFLYPMWATWCTAYARHNLFDGIIFAGKDFVYCDTDSVKMLNGEAHKTDVEAYNARIDEKIKKALLYYQLDFEPLEGIGRFTDEGTAEEFKTLRAKAYLKKQNGKYDLTMSGLNKNAVEYMIKKGKGDPFKFFKNGFTVPKQYTGRTTHFYGEGAKAIVKDYLGQKAEIKEDSYIYIEQSPFHFDYTDDYIIFKDFMQNVEFYVEQ